MTRWRVAVRTTSLILLGILVAAVFLLTPAGAHVNKKFRHLWKQHLRPKIGYETVVSPETTITSGNEATVTATCPGNKRVVGGGFRSTGNYPDVIVARSSAPASNNHAWTVRAANFGGTTESIEAIAICTRL